MNTIYIIRGLPGSGKTTYAKTLNIPHFEADDYFESEAFGYQFDASKLKQAHEWCQNKTDAVLKMGMDVVVANTFTTIKEIDPYVNIALKHRAKIALKTCNGNYGSIHDVPQETIQKMRNRFVPDNLVIEHYLKKEVDVFYYD